MEVVTLSRRIGCKSDLKKYRRMGYGHIGYGSLKQKSRKENLYGWHTFQYVGNNGSPATEWFYKGILINFWTREAFEATWSENTSNNLIDVCIGKKVGKLTSHGIEKGGKDE